MPFNSFLSSNTNTLLPNGVFANITNLLELQVKNIVLKIYSLFKRQSLRNFLQLRGKPHLIYFKIRAQWIPMHGVTAKSLYLNTTYRYMSSNAISFLPEGMFDILTNLEIL